MKRGCILCGGKVINGICSECGMDNRKTDEQYLKILDRHQAENEEKAHAFRKAKKEARKKAMKKKEAWYSRNRAARSETVRKNSGTGFKTAVPREKVSRTYSRQGAVSSGKENKKKRTLLWIFVIILVLWFGQSLYEFVHREVAYVKSWLGGSSQEETYNEEEWDPYDYVDAQLNPEGEHWRESLDAGMYVVGADLPEGEYTITGEEGNSYHIWNAQHSLSVTEYFGPEDYEIHGSREGAKLLAGTLLNVDGGTPMIFETENGQTADMTPRQSNPLTETYEFADTAVAGIDFPAGTYDVEVAEDQSAFFEYEIQMGDGEDAYPVSFYALLILRFRRSIRNTVLPIRMSFCRKE